MQSFSGLYLPQVKLNLLSSLKIFVYKLPHKLLNDLRLKILENEEILGKCQNFVTTEPSGKSPLKTH